MTDERRELQEAVRRLLAEHGDARAAIEADASQAMDRTLWERLTQQIGIAGLLAPERAGGLGAELADAAAVFEELGAGLAPVPAFSSIALTTSILRELDEGAADEILGRLASGEAIAAFAATELHDPWSLPDDAPSASGDQGTVRLDGVVPIVFDGGVADVLLVPTRGPSGLVLTVADAQAEGVERVGLETLDLGRRATRIRFTHAIAEVVAGPQVAGTALAAGLDTALVLLAAEQVGLAARCHANAVEYARTREQFQRPIGSFQAIKHLLVDLLLDLEMARASLSHAVEVADRRAPGDDTAPEVTAAASATAMLCKRMTMRVARETLHVFGGIGFTWEHDAHLAFRRAKTTELLLGDAAWHGQRLTRSLAAS